MKLIIHCGFGKTGTTSIQRTLLSNNNQLIKNGYFYCGMNFETLGVDKKWKEIPWGFNSLTNEDFIQEYSECASIYAKEAKKKSCHTLILSNEGFSDNLDKICLFSKNMINKGFNIELIFYTRHPLKWLISAYQQWGIKHKSNVGEILTLNDFFVKGVHYRFKNAIKSLKMHELTNLAKFKKLEDALHKDVSIDFLSELGLNYHDFNIIRDNEKLSKLDESIYFANNSLSKDICFPKKTVKLINKYKQRNSHSDNYLSRYNLNESYLKEIDDYLMELKDLSDGEINYVPEKYIMSSDNVDIYVFNMMRTLCEIDNDANIDALRDAAIKLEKNDSELSFKLMKLAFILRPNGPYIQKKLNEYEFRKTIKNK